MSVGSTNLNQTSLQKASTISAMPTPATDFPGAPFRQSDIIIVARAIAGKRRRRGRKVAMLAPVTSLPGAPLCQRHIIIVAHAIAGKRRRRGSDRRWRGGALVTGTTV